VIHTPESVARTNRRLDRANERKRKREEEAGKVVDALRNGASLHRCHHRDRTIWGLSNGQFATAEAAMDALRDPHVVGVGDSLFGPTELSQTFRYVED
jgi:hypothetical protein